MEDLEEIVERTGDRIAYLPMEGAAYDAWKRVGSKIKGFWSTSSGMGPEPCVALSAAINAGDEPRIQEIMADMRSLPRAMPAPKEGEPFAFPSLNTQFEKARFRAAGYVNCGMPRAPYSDDDLPDDWKAGAEAHGKAWAEMRKKYIKAAV
jgi:hypothetical protein